MADEFKDRVISYVIANDGKAHGMTAELNQALKDGYRVIRVFQTPMGTHGIVCVTVVLTSHDENSEYKAND